MDSIRHIYNAANDLLAAYVEVGGSDEELVENLEMALQEIAETYFHAEPTPLDTLPEEEPEIREDLFISDTDADADALKSIGWGVDEDYRTPEEEAY
jgi:hypothetical protein